MKGIADTGFLVAFLSRHDRHNDWATCLAGQSSEPLLTCEAVLAETAFHLRSCLPVLALLNRRLIKVAFNADDHLAQLESLAVRYLDQQPDLADVCLIRMSELFPDHSVLTTDRKDFAVYRRNKRDMIPVILPPEK